MPALSLTPGKWCLGDLVHVVAQLPAEVSLELEADANELGLLDHLRRGYGLEDRIRLREAAPTAWRFQGVADTAPRWATHGSLDIRPPETMAEMVESLWPLEGGSSPARGDDSVFTGHRFAVVMNLPTHYRVSLLNGLSKRVGDAGASLRVFFGGSSAPARPWLQSVGGLQFDHEFLRSVSIPVRRHRTPFLPLNLRGALASFRPTIVIGAGFSPFSTANVALYAKRLKIPFGLWSGETPSLAAQSAGGALRRTQRRWLARQASFGIAYGSLAARYLTTLAPRLPVVIGRNTSVADASRPKELSGNATLELVAVADLSLPGKGIDVVVDALELVRDLPCRLTVIGGMPGKRSTIENRTRDDRIHFLGPLPHEDVLAAFRRSDVFLFPSRVDPFGLALVEAMASELAVITSPAAGASADLTVHGTNSLLAEPGVPGAWADGLLTLSRNEDLRRSISLRARQTIDRRWTISHAVEATTAGFRLGALVGRDAQ
jgi:glycosyltransferase involved in cell wall biosynthesis